MNKEANLILFPEVEKLARHLNHAQFGEMILAVMAYAYRGEVYQGEDPMVNMAIDMVMDKVDRGKNVSKERARAAKIRWGKDADACKEEQEDANHAPVQSNPDQSSPDQSNPDQSSPGQSAEKMEEDNHCFKKGRVSPGAAAPSPTKKVSFGKFGWVRLSRKEYQALEEKLGHQELERCIAYLDESCQSTGNKNRWKDFGLVIRKCSEEEWGKHPYGNVRQEIPKGASGIIGEAEMGFIRNAMKEVGYESGTS